VTGSSLAWKKVSPFFVIRQASVPQFPMFQFRQYNVFLPLSVFLMQCIDYWQEFSSDMGSRTVKRIADVCKLRNYQFPQVTFFFLFCYDYFEFYSDIFLIVPLIISISYLINYSFLIFLTNFPGCWSHGPSSATTFLYQG